MNKWRKIISIAAAAAVISGAVIFFYTALRQNATFAGVAFADIIVLLMLMIAVMAALLSRSMKKTLYSYENIGLTGGIIFAAVLLIVLVRQFVFCLAENDFSLAAVYGEIAAFPRTFSYYAVFVIAAVCVLLGISNIALIRHEGFRLHNALSVLVAALYIGGTAAVYAVADVLEKYVFANEGPVFLILNTSVSSFILLMLCYFECVLAGTAIMGWKAARTKPSYDKDYMIILGCSIDRRGGLLPLLKGRVNRAIRFAWEQEIATGRQMKYVPSGGQGANEVMSEGSAMELYLLSRGAESYEVFPEKKSTTTYENMAFSKAIIDELKPGAKIAFATTNYHILRSGILARRAGLDAEGVAGDTKWYFWPNGFVREFFGILALNVKAHVITAAAIAVVCAATGVIGGLVL